MPRKKQPPPKRPVGRPFVIIDLEQLTALAGINCTLEEAAAVLKCGPRTLKARLKSDPATREAWENGHLYRKVSLRRLQWRHAKGNGASAVKMTIHMSEHQLGEAPQTRLKHTGAVGVYDLSKVSDNNLALIESILSPAALDQPE